MSGHCMFVGRPAPKPFGAPRVDLSNRAKMCRPQQPTSAFLRKMRKEDALQYLTIPPRNMGNGHGNVEQFEEYEETDEDEEDEELFSNGFYRPAYVEYHAPVEEHEESTPEDDDDELIFPMDL